MDSCKVVLLLYLSLKILKNKRVGLGSNPICLRSQLCSHLNLLHVTYTTNSEHKKCKILKNVLSEFIFTEEGKETKKEG